MLQVPKLKSIFTGPGAVWENPFFSKNGFWGFHPPCSASTPAGGHSPPAGAGVLPLAQPYGALKWISHGILKKNIYNYL